MGSKDRRVSADRMLVNKKKLLLNFWQSSAKPLLQLCWLAELVFISVNPATPPPHTPTQYYQDPNQGSGRVKMAVKNLDTIYTA